MRLGEALNLRAADMDWSEGILTIRGTKFGKSRLVPLHASTCKIMAKYSKRRIVGSVGFPMHLYWSIRTATGWTKARSIGHSISCPGRLGCAMWVRVVVLVCTISATALRSILCFGGTGAAMTRNANYLFFLRILDTFM